MSADDAYMLSRDFDPAPAQPFCVPFHYLLYARAGAMRLESGGRRWTLPPARAALIAAGHEIEITLPQKVSAASALFRPGFVPDPPATLAVFDMTPLARALVDECRNWGEADRLGAYGAHLFQTLAAVAWRLAEAPSPAVIPAGRSAPVRQALAMMAERLEEPPPLDALAAATATSPRTLARRFHDELGLSYRQVLQQMRMARAIEALASGDAPVTQVALAVGYSSLSAFNAAFRAFTGQTPSAYRASFRP